MNIKKTTSKNKSCFVSKSNKTTKTRNQQTFPSSSFFIFFSIFLQVRCLFLFCSSFSICLCCPLIPLCRFNKRNSPTFIHHNSLQHKKERKEKEGRKKEKTEKEMKRSREKKKKRKKKQTTPKIQQGGENRKQRRSSEPSSFEEREEISPWTA